MTKIQKNNVAVIGLGQMGSGIAKNIDNAGFLRAVVDNNKNAISTYDSRKNILVNNNIDMCNSCDVLIFVVPSTKQISEIIFDQDGIISNLKEGTVIVDLTTSDPKESSRLSKKLEEYKISYLDCGMTGGATGADNGTLTLMIGGKIEKLNEVSPILESFTNKLFHVGKSGSGHALKLLHNMVTHTIFFSNVEAVRAAKEFEISPEKVIEVFNAGNARSYISEFRFPVNVLSGEWNARSKVSNLQKDLKMATDILNEKNIPNPYGSLTSDLLDQAMEIGMENTDFSKIYLEYENLVNLYNKK